MNSLVDILTPMHNCMKNNNKEIRYKSPVQDKLREWIVNSEGPITVNRAALALKIKNGRRTWVSTLLSKFTNEGLLKVVGKEPAIVFRKNGRALKKRGGQYFIYMKKDNA